MFKLSVNPEDAGKRVDNVATKNINALKPELEVSRSIIQRMIGTEEILLNGAPVKQGHKVKEGDTIKIDLERLRSEAILELDRAIPRPEKLPLDIIYEDDDILVVNKPAGMVVHPACGNYSGTLVNALLDYPGFQTEFNIRDRTRDEGRGTKDKVGDDARRTTHDTQRIMRPGIVHRLDKDTSGIMLVAKTGIAHRRLTRQLKERSIIKKYIAIVKGIVELDEGIINAPVAHNKKDRRKMAIDEDEGKEAVTLYRVIKRDRVKNRTVLEVIPKTGRTHQIRVHLGHIGYPVVGDTSYNGQVIGGLSRQALHAKSIRFIHPVQNKPMEFSAKIPADLEVLMQ